MLHRLATLAGAVALVGLLAPAAAAQQASGLRSVGDFAGIEDETQRSVALFEEMGKVVTHPRCVNCHPRGDRPLQGDDQHPHEPPVFRGESDFGLAGMRCNTCHGPENVAYLDGSGTIPGHDPWMLAPVETAWQGMTLAAICQQLKDPERNGDRTLAELHEHMAEDGLVGWGWHSGAGRTPAPGTQEQFGELVAAWIDTGAHCPAE